MMTVAPAFQATPIARRAAVEWYSGMGVKMRASLVKWLRCVHMSKAMAERPCVTMAALGKPVVPDV